MRAWSSISLALVGLAAAAPINSKSNATALAAPDCNFPVAGLSFEDCVHMANIGMAGMGDNTPFNNGHIWLGADGPNVFNFVNRSPDGAPVTLILWDFPPGDFEASFMNVRRPKISYSLPSNGAAVSVSLANGVSGGWAVLRNRQTTLSQFGQIYNTWGEFTTGDFATVNVSRLVNMGGNAMSIRVPTGCLADMNMCSFHCKNGANECGASQSYDLLGCTPDVNPNASYGTWDGVNPEGGCMGWSNGGRLDIDFN